MTLLEIHPDQITYTSDYFDQLYQHAINIIRKGLAYVDDTDVATVSSFCKVQILYLVKISIIIHIHNI